MCRFFAQEKFKTIANEEPAPLCLCRFFRGGLVPSVSQESSVCTTIFRRSTIASLTLEDMQCLAINHLIDFENVSASQGMLSAFGSRNSEAIPTILRILSASQERSGSDGFIP